MIVLDSILADTLSARVTLNGRKLAARPLSLATQMDVERAVGSAPEGGPEQTAYFRRCQAVCVCVAVGAAVTAGGSPTTWEQTAEKDRPAWAKAAAQPILEKVTLNELNAAFDAISNPIAQRARAASAAAVQLRELADEVKAAGSDGPAWGNTHAVETAELETSLRMAADELERRGEDALATAIGAARGN